MFNPTYEDNYPTTHLEAIACKTPVVCYRTGGAVETVHEDFVVEQGDYKGAYAVMRTLFEKTKQYPFMDRDQLSKDVMHNKYLELIKEILNK